MLRWNYGSAFGLWHGTLRRLTGTHVAYVSAVAVVDDGVRRSGG